MEDGARITKPARAKGLATSRIGRTRSKRADSGVRSSAVTAARSGRIEVVETVSLYGWAGCCLLRSCHDFVVAMTVVRITREVVFSIYCGRDLRLARPRIRYQS